ncbi:carboxymuconolactone decarboxylase family protein [Actinocorallia longicatena]|uniref:Carboxymuconolactone decarboxylase family protein n=1 Tax=Actinocorallia longicatena TaxID=111803 RepID=A0ABP6QE33_9ACTN
MARIAPLEPPYSPEADALLTGMMPPGQPPIGLFRLFARNLPMAAAMHGWGRYELGRELSLSMRQREIVITRTCALCRCEYEWGVHVAMFAGRVKLTPEQIASLTHGDAADPCWTSPDEALLIRVADGLHARGDIADELWAPLAAAFGAEQILDLLLLCGWYHAISFTATAARLPLEPGAPAFADFASPPPTG